MIGSDINIVFDKETFGVDEKNDPRLAANDALISNNITYIANKCIKQEYQRLFLKVNPVFPALKNS